MPPTRRRVSDVFDAVFILIALVCVGWLSVRLLIASFQLSWVSFVPILGFYAVVAYLLLPRLHQVFTNLYVPDYFIGRTRTGDGLLGDPVNLAFDGTEADLHAAMRAAGWSLADEITIASSFKMIASTVFRRTYKEAPVSDLMLFRRRQDFAYQQEVGGDASKRHHVRFWKVPDGWLLPGGVQVGWVAAGTYDRRVGLSLFTGQVTHKIDPDTDAERDYIVDTVRYADPAVGLHIIDGFSIAYHSRNGGGDSIRTDGNLPIVDANGAAQRSPGPLPVPVSDAAAITKHHIPPAGLLFAGLLVLLRSVQTVLLLPLVVRIVRAEMGETWMVIVACATFVSFPLLYLTLWLLTLARRRWARTLFMVTLSLDAVSSLLETVPHGAMRIVMLAGVALSVMTLLMVSGSAARAWVDERKKPGVGAVNADVSS
ncbi:hypothetical protein BW730_02875 [Tessaracoccus aquimaris]|uniref:LssY-like C-terminal domain-containing protein n=1 Tax=Tessaracoccus aquimaris TaxID=1332264 RepID=A0A1Q2CSW4_9ACTN|nr:hypothetical protein BW730_02875 [Tessaracoccus aquimaris]